MAKGPCACEELAPAPKHPRAEMAGAAGMDARSLWDLPSSSPESSSENEYFGQTMVFSARQVMPKGWTQDFKSALEYVITGRSQHSNLMSAFRKQYGQFCCRGNATIKLYIG